MTSDQSQPRRGTGSESSPEGVESEAVHGELGLRQGLALALLLRVFSRRARREDPESPGVVSGGDERSQKVFQAANRLAREGVDVQRAAKEILQLAGGHKKVLRHAEELGRLGGRHHDFALSNRAYRLLVAARDGRPVMPADPDERVVFERLDKLFAKDRLDGDIWHDLIALEPRLEPLRQAASRGDYGPRRNFNARKNELSGSLDRELIATEARGALALRDQVKLLAGPNAQGSDPIINARRTRDWINFHLDAERPIRQDA